MNLNTLKISKMTVTNQRSVTRLVRMSACSLASLSSISSLSSIPYVPVLEKLSLINETYRDLPISLCIAGLYF